MYKSKKLLITGGTGSFGNAVLRRFLDSDLAEIRIFSRDEKKQNDMRNSIQNDKLKFHLGDVRDIDSVMRACTGVDYVFHAAALKQVPSCEFYPMEAVKTNVLGAENILKASVSSGVKRCVVLSTDKAVYPINAMGISKAMMEKVMVAFARESQPPSSVFCATRYGNVMGSRGSVIPLFIDQIKNKQSITITDPLMTRFLMTLEESVDLVDFAFEHANPGDIFIQKAPACTVLELAKALIFISGSNSEIKIIGTRHGEKLYESLVSREELVRSEDLGRYYRIPSDNRDLNYSKYFTQGEDAISEAQDYTSHNTLRLNGTDVINKLLEVDIVRNFANGA